MIKIKELAENILDDLMIGAPLSDILLKTKILASKRNDQELLNWVTHELDGYEEEPPSYRIINAGVKVDVFVPFRGTVRIEFPTDIISHKQIGERLSRMPFHNSIAEVENLCTQSEESPTLQMRIPVAAYGFMKPFINGDIQDSYQYVSKAAVKQITVAVKSLLIDFLLKLSREEDINFNSFIKNRNMDIENNNITAGVVNIGNGNIVAQDSTVVTGQNNVVNIEYKNELHTIINSIDKIVLPIKEDSEYQAVSTDIKEEINKENPSKNFLKRCFQAIPAVLGSISSDVIANQISPYISQALALLA